MRNKIAPMIITRVATPPITPPTIAPVLLEDFGVGVLDVEAVGVDLRDAGATDPTKGEVVDEVVSEDIAEVLEVVSVVDVEVFEVVDDVPEGFFRVVFPSRRKTPFLSLQHPVARVPLPQQ